MKLKALFLVLLLLSGCAFHRVETRSPELFVQLSIAPQTCLLPGRKPAEVYVFIHPIAIPTPTAIEVEINGRKVGTVYANPSATVQFERVGLGAHTLVLRGGGLVVEQYFSVWDCGR